MDTTQRVSVRWQIRDRTAASSQTVAAPVLRTGSWKLYRRPAAGWITPSKTQSIPVPAFGNTGLLIRQNSVPLWRRCGADYRSFRYADSRWHIQRTADNYWTPSLNNILLLNWTGAAYDLRSVSGTLQKGYVPDRNRTYAAQIHWRRMGLKKGYPAAGFTTTG